MDGAVGRHISQVNPDSNLLRIVETGKAPVLIEPFKADTRDRLAAYREKFFKHLRKTEQTGDSN